MDVIRKAMYAVLANDHPQTVRQVFYRLVSEGIIAKTEAEYKATVVRLLTQMRRARQIPFEWVADNTRWMRKPHTYASLESALAHTAMVYRRSIWDNQRAYVEVWLEKDALAGVLYTETASWDVPLMVTRGYSSLSFVYAAAEAIAEVNKPAFIYYFGDHDPSGLDIDRHIEQRLREYALDAEIVFERVAVTPDQIARWNLPTRPTKATDTRARRFVGKSVELDAVPAHILRELYRQKIEQHIDRHALKVTRIVENEERAMLYRLVKQGLA